ncbi:hypothetical protein [Chlamydia avium]|uniref:Phage T7 tail fiber family protein n=1 Tax=Chlamydia avium 10DC88 TaxID=1229831 RepID=W8JQG7_9CHLA|nr:hypothetical protein [Chlamydia avium]AHK63093.1 Phage T7 tail fiber family protein [Chlamydia avium 10DC88]
MKNNTEYNQASQINLLTSTTQTTNSSIFTVTSSGISSSKPINMNSQNISGLATPSNDSDAVPLEYLKSNFVLKSDPDSGYLPTAGGTLTGNINMGGNKITNLGMGDSPQDSDAVNFKYLSEKVSEVTNNKDLTDAISSISSALDKMNNIEAALGIVSEDEEDDGSETTSSAQFISVSGGTMNGNLDMSNHTVTGIKTPADTETQYAVNVEYVQSKITLPQVGMIGNTVSNPISTSSSGYFNWEEITTSATETPSTTPTPAESTESAQPTSIISPKMSISSSTTTPTTTQTSSSSLITTPTSSTYLKIEDSDKTSMQILGVGIVTLCFSVTSSNDTKSNISVILNPPASTSSGGEEAEETSTNSTGDTVVYEIPSLASGQPVCCQIPVQTQNSVLKIKTSISSTRSSVPNTSGSSSSSESSSSSSVSSDVSSGDASSVTSSITSWSYQVTLLPSIFPTSSS